MLSGIVIEVNPVQELKALVPILVTLLGMVIEVSPEQPPKAEPPMLVTLLGMVIEVNLEQPEKVPSPMVVTLSGIFTLNKLVQLAKDACMFVTLLEIVALVKLLAFINAYVILVHNSPISALTVFPIYRPVAFGFKSPLPSSSTTEPSMSVNLQKNGGGGGL
jgi:hypothetical protein